MSIAGSPCDVPDVDAPDAIDRVEGGIVVVVIPDATSLTWANVSRLLAWHNFTAHLPVPAFPVRHHGIPGLVTRWSERDLLEPIRHRSGIHHAAGGRLYRLDLSALTIPARQSATARWWTWSQHIAATTPPARPWQDYLAEHRRNPEKLPLPEARRRFQAQPRVLAMLAFNSYPYSPFHLSPEELGAYQAGATVYVALHWQHPIVGDVLIAPAGQLLRPASTSIADRLIYLATATRIVHSLSPRDHLAIVQAATPPGTTPAP
ncbi:MAG: hypothetical protein QG597_4635 [Actinomycetota bacterium]|nr:hypothetical protein [Actinomycetota bacterium]